MNAVLNTIFTAAFPVFSGSRFSAKYVKDVEIKARITKDSVYDTNNKHWIYFEVIESNDHIHYEPGKQYKKQGKNFYEAILTHVYPENYDDLAEIKNSKKLLHGILPKGF